ncbi:MAG: hypothetical protein KF696_08365 [Planctomycetes bacterium]|nr:hypothetical protein [Planctomycetota bacterium]MCW8135635.1 hypothetical protein [Planctomycetota bacterium]
MKAFVAILAVCACASLPAQDQLAVSGTVADGFERAILVNVNFGGAPQSLTLTLNIAATSGSAGLDVELIDLDELAANGSTAATVEDSDPGTGNIMLTLPTGNYSGTRQFAILVYTNTNGTSPFSGTLSEATLAPGSMTLAGQVTNNVSAVPARQTLFDRSARHVVEHPGARTTTSDVRVNFGGGTQAVTFWVSAITFAGDTTVQVYEIDSTGAEQLLGSTVASGLGSSEINVSSSARTGNVTFRFKIITPGASIVSAYWAVFPGTVSVSGFAGGGGGGGDKGSCTTTGAGSGWLAVAGTLAALVLGLRLYRTRA